MTDAQRPGRPPDPERRRAVLAATLAALTFDGPDLATALAGDLMGLLFAVETPAVRFGLAPPLADTDRGAAVARAVAQFLILHGPGNRP